MKIMSLNIWGGHVHAPLLNFIQQNEGIDIFCFQEVYHNAPYKISTEDRQNHLEIFSELQHALPQHTGYFRPVVNNIYGISVFTKNTLEILNEGEVIIHDNPNYTGSGPAHKRILQFIECRMDQKTYCVINVHGLWNGKGKTDSPERLLQSQRIRDFMNSLKIPVILCGDFNLNPDTESLMILEENMVNLIKTHNIASTRSRFYPKEGKFADYILVSHEIQIKQFLVLPDEVSDHLALVAELI